MTTAFLVPAMARSNLDSSNWSLVGFKTYSPLIYPTRTPAIGPRKGMLETVKALEAPIMANMSGSFC